MTDSLLAGISALAGWNLSMLTLLAKATLILFVALGVTLAMQRASAGARHLVWLVTLVALLLVPALTAWAPLPVRILPAANMSGAPALRSVPADVGPGIQGDPIQSDNAGVASTAGSAETQQAATVSPLRTMSGISILGFIWAAVLVAIAASLAYAALAVRRIVRHGRALDSQDWLTPLWEVSDRLGLDEPPRLIRSEDAKMPFACGVFNPTIVLPAECDTWTLDRRRAVLLHELAHVKRHDLVGHTLGRLACAVYWFHPLVWTAAKRLRSESERACDDLALASGARATDYAEHLLDIVTSVRRDTTPSVALAMARRKEFEGRMLAILDPELRHSSPSRRESAALIGSLALISIVVGAAAPAPRADRRATDSTLGLQTSASISEEWSPDKDRHIESSNPRQPVADGDVGRIVPSAIPTPTPTPTPLGLRDLDDRPSFGSPTALLRQLMQGTPSGTTKGADERPVLLAKILQTDTDTKLRRIAAWGLAEYADQPVAAEALASALRRDGNVEVREMAAWALNDADDAAVVIDALSAALRSDASVQVRAISAWALGGMGSRNSAEPLTAALGDASPEVRMRALWALGNIDLREAPNAVIALLKDRDPRVRELAAWVLYHVEDPRSISALEAALRAEPNKPLQIAYIRALAAVGEKSVDAIRSLLESRDPEIKSIAVRALAGGHATGPWPWPWPEPRPFPD